MTWRSARVAPAAASARSAVALMSLGVRGGDEIVIAGFDPAAAGGVAAIWRRLIRSLERGVPAPRPAAPANYSGGGPVIASRGFAVGSAAPFEMQRIEVREQGAGTTRESAAFEQARAAVRARLEQRAGGGAAAVRAIMAAHLELLDDPQLLGSTRAGSRPARARPLPGGPASRKARAALLATGDAHLMERAADFEDLERQVLRELAGSAAEPARIADGSILIARDLTPSQLLELDAARLGGIALLAGRPDFARGHPRGDLGCAHAGGRGRRSAET